MADGEDTERGPWSEETVKAAREWVDGLSSPSGLKGAWRLMTLDERVSILPDGTRKSRPTRLTRFAKGCPLPLMPAAEKYLLGIAPYTGLIFNGVPLEGTYRPTRTRWIRDDQWSQDEARRPSENRHTLVQDLVESTAPDGDGVVQSEDCVELVTAEYHWDEASPPEGPGPASQGVAVSLQQVRRAEDGTYSYVVVTRTAKTRVGAEAEVECTKFRRVVQQDFANLYGSPGEGFTDGGGSAVSVPPMSCGGDGTVVEWRNLRQNDDCTWNLSAVTTSGVRVDGVERTSRETAVELRDSVRDAAEAGPLEHVREQDAATGTVWEQRSEMRPDGLYDNTVSRVVEKTLEGQVVERRRTVRGATERIVNRHMQSAAPAPEGLGSVTNTVTDSGRIDQEITRVWHTGPLDAGAECQTTVFEHQEADRTVRPEKPPRHYRDAGGGKRYGRTSRITEEGSFEVVETETTELPRTDAEVTVQKTLRGVRETRLDRNAAAPLPTTGLGVGETRKSELTPGGLWNNTLSTSSKETVGKIGLACEKTVFEHQQQRVDNQVSEPAGHVGDAGGGVRRQRTARMTEEGTWDVTDVETTEVPQANAEVTVQKTIRGTRETRVDRSAAAPLPTTGLEVGETRKSELTPGGLYNNTVSVSSKEPVGEIGLACEKTVFEHQRQRTDNQVARPAGHVGDAGGGVRRQRTARMTEEGTWDVTTVETEELPKPGSAKSWRKTLRGVRETTVDRNAGRALDGSNLQVGDERQSEMTPGGLWNNTTVTFSKEPVGDVGSDCQTTVFEHQHSGQENVAERPDSEASSAGGGKTYRKTARQTEEGTWDVTTVETEELPKPGSAKSWRKTLRGVRETTVDRNAGRALDGSNLQVGDERQSEMTPGGLWNNTTVTFSKEPVGEIGEACQATAVIHVHSSTENVAAKPSVERGAVGPNVERSVSARETEEGTWDVETRTTTFKEFPDTEVASVDNPSQSESTHVFQNLVEVPRVGAGTGKSVNISVSRNEHGSYDGRYTVVTGKPFGEVEIARADNDSQTVEFHTFQNLSSAPDMTASRGQEISASVSRNSLGLFDGSFRRVTGKPWGPEVIASYSSPVQSVSIHTYQNLGSVPQLVGGIGEQYSASASRNSLGLFDGTWRHVVSKGVDTGWIEWDTEIKSPSNQVVKYKMGIRVFKNLRTVPDPGSGDVQLTVQIGDDGLYSGHMTRKKLLSWHIDNSGPSDGGVASETSVEDKFSGGYRWHRVVNKRAYTGRMRPSAGELVKVSQVIGCGSLGIITIEEREWKRGKGG